MTPTPRQVRQLVKAAFTAARRAHAPYSGFHVGAALLLHGGRIVTACNVENASYGLTNCAERAAVQTAVASGARRFVALAVAADGQEFPYPCGACRQVLAEFCDPDLPIYVVRRAGLCHPRMLTLGELLPFAFVLSRRHKREEH